MSLQKFPDDFIWGTATAGHQIEGNNKNSDWWKWENRDRSKDTYSPFIDKSKYPLEPSELACDSYNRFEEDFELSLKLNNSAIRIGLEWARIEPEENNIDKTEISHYANVLNTAKNKGLKTFVTLNHFVLPVWAAEQDGWVNQKIVDKFAQFAELVATELGESIDHFLTINEPQVYALMSYLHGRWPPQKNNPYLTFKCLKNFAEAHNEAYSKIKSVNSVYSVGIVKNINWFSGLGPISKALYYMNSDYFLNKVKDNIDLLGVNFYFTHEIKNFKYNPDNYPLSDFSWPLNPKGIYHILKDVNKYNVPIYITENGLADADDSRRTKYLKGILEQCLKAIDEGVNLKGYFHWSLLDNYEWAEGYKMKFGLVEIDRKNNLKRIPRPSFYEYAKICKTGNINYY